MKTRTSFSFSARAHASAARWFNLTACGPIGFRRDVVELGGVVARHVVEEGVHAERRAHGVGADTATGCRSIARFRQ
jgi:hypothetical protein